MLYLITPDLEYYDEKFFEKINSYLNNGLAILQFRSTLVSNEHQQKVVRKLVKECEKKSCNLLVNGTGEEAIRLGAHGVHLQSSSLMKLKQRPLSDDYWVAGSCHNNNEIIHASKIGLDFCVLSPVHNTKTHPGISGFGWAKFGNLAEQSTIPIYALGGIQPGELKSAQENGAHGIAMITGLWNSNNPESIIEKLK